MVALKEVVASYTIQVDDAALKGLQSQLARTSAQVAATGKKLSEGLSVDQLGRWTAGLAAATATVGFATVKMASDVEETNNVVQQTFKESSDSVFAWSKDAAKAMGRSEYDLQRYAGNVGAFLSPVFEGTGADIAGISKEISALAVDLASFYNLNDQEAILALQSGLSGETEAVRRFGINLSDERLNVLNKEIRGQNAIYKNLGLREKTELRLLAIEKDTVDKQGDAVRTADSWANQLKALEADYKKITVTIGQALLPLAKEYLGVFRDISTNLKDQGAFFQKHIRSFESMAYFLGISATSWALMKTSSDGTALSMGKNLAVLGAIWLVMDDITHFQAKQNSLLADGLSLITGQYFGAEKLRLTLEGVFEALSTTTRMTQAAATLDFDTLRAIDEEIKAAGGSVTPRTDRARARLNGGISTQAVQQGDPAAFLAAEADLRGPVQNEGEQRSRFREFLIQREAFIKENPNAVTNEDRETFGLAPLTRPSAQYQELFKKGERPAFQGPGLLGQGVLQTPLLEASGPPLREVPKQTVTNTVTVNMTVNGNEEPIETLQQKLSNLLYQLIPTTSGREE